MRATIAARPKSEPTAGERIEAWDAPSTIAELVEFWAERNRRYEVRKTRGVAQPLTPAEVNSVLAVRRAEIALFDKHEQAPAWAALDRFAARYRVR